MFMICHMDRYLHHDLKLLAMYAIERSMCSVRCRLASANEAGVLKDVHVLALSLLAPQKQLTGCTAAIDGFRAHAALFLSSSSKLRDQ